MREYLYMPVQIQLEVDFPDSSLFYAPRYNEGQFPSVMCLLTDIYGP